MSQEPNAKFFSQIDPQMDRQGLAQLSRRGWAWEFLRRNPEYKADFYAGSTDASVAARWGLLHFCDPIEDAMAADVFWRHEDCPEVLPLAVSGERLATQLTLDLDGLSCRAIRRTEPQLKRQDILFSEHGRFLQLAIFGDIEIKGASLMVAALGDPVAIMARTAALRRLNDLLFSKTMRRSLYPSESRAPRLTTVLTALDGWLAQMPQRDIATTIFSKSRVEREWNDPSENLRDQVRRAIGYGQELMNGGYRQFLQLTFARRIAAPRAPCARQVTANSNQVFV